MVTKDLMAITKQPGEDGVNSFRLEVFRRAGDVTPLDVITMILKIAEDMVIKNEIGGSNFKEPRKLLVALLETDIGLESRTISNTRGDEQ